MGTFNVSKGFTSHGHTLKSGDTMNVYSGGRAVNTVLKGGRLNVNNGATANSITIYSGYAAISYAAASNIVISNSGRMTIFQSSVINNTNIKSGGTLCVSSSTAKNTTINGGVLSMGVRGIVRNTTVNAGELHVGGTSFDTVVRSSGVMYVSSGGTASATTVNSGGTLRISKGYAVSTVVNSGGIVIPISAGVVADTIVNSGGTLIADYYGTANRTTVVAGGCVQVSNCGTASATTVSSGGSLLVIAGAAVSTTVCMGGLADIRYNGTANYASVVAGGCVRVSGTANFASVSSGGNLCVCVGGTAGNATVNSGGSLHVSSGGRATFAMLNGAWSFSYNGNTQFINSGCMYVSSGGAALYTTVNAGAVYVLRGGTAEVTTVLAGGNIAVYGIANSTTVSSGGTLCISSGGRAGGVTVYSGGTALIGSGGMITGKVFFYSGTVVSAYSGAIIDFDISLFGPGSDARISNLSVVGGWNNARYTLTMSSSQTAGTYTLATGAAGFNQTVTVRNTSGTQLATLTVGGRASIGGTNYTLELSNGNLSLRMVTDVTPPKVSNMRANTTSQTNKNVTVSATFSDNVGVAQSLYRIGSDGEWQTYSSKGGVTVTENATVYFKAVDREGNESEIQTYQVKNIDKIAPTVTNVKEVSSGSSKVVVTAVFQDNVAVTSSLYKIGSGSWQSYSSKGVTLSENATVYFKALDKAGNVSEVASYQMTSIPPRDTVAPTVTNVTASTTAKTNRSVIVTANCSDNIGVTQFLYRIGTTGSWQTYSSKGVTVSTNTTVYFKALDKAGNVSEIRSCEISNIDKVAPSLPDGLAAVVSGQTAVLVWNPGTDTDSGIRNYLVTYSGDGREFTAAVNGTKYVLADLASGAYSWSVQAVDNAGNESAAVSGKGFVVSGSTASAAQEPEAAPRTQTWKTAGEAARYAVEYSMDDFKHVIRLATVESNSLDAFRMPAGSYQVRVRTEEGADWSVVDSGETDVACDEPRLVRSDADGNMDVFFANASGAWEGGYRARHVGSINDWNGTGESVILRGKNKLADLIEGSTDANVLLMTDDDNGDALFVDDIYTALPDVVAEQQARIARIDEIRAGAGDDVVDMTSQRFEYIGDGLTIRGGAGNDVLWANRGDNELFGDAGNDRIAGASGDDLIAGGAGDDRMHGGGGNDVFTFCDNWGVDTVEQLASGTVTLWFASGDKSNWDADTLTFADGGNSVRVSGVSADRITLKFGDDGSDRYAALASAGAFLESTSERIFEDAGHANLA